jgi:uncharacterized protein YfaS (alpha-2-macroglobulin family)
MSDVSKPFQARRFGLAIVLLALSSAVVAHRQTPGRSATPKKDTVGVSTPSTDWKEIDRLVSEQKFEEATAAVARLRQAARVRGDEAEWTRALIREVQLRTGLHGYETAVRFLKAEPWPKGLLGRTALELFYAQSLVNYFHAYSWEIQQRERVESSGAVDLKAWTGTQIYAEAVRAYLRLWPEREALGREDVKALPEFLEPNSYPSGVRGTLRDALSYLFAAHLADTSGWSPAQSNEVFRLDLPGLLRSGAARSVKLDEDAAHPLVRLAAVLDDLETWHRGRGEREGAFEARLERLRRLFASFSEEEDRRRIEKDLEERLSSVTDVPWFAMGKAQLAEFVERPDLSGDLVRARVVAEEGRRAYPDSIGGRRCLAIVKRIEAPDYQLSAMQSDGAGRRSILVSHKNVRNLRFRAFALDLAQRVETARNLYSILPNGEELRKFIEGLTPRAEWGVALPATTDYRSHATYVTPPMKEPGLYIVAASGAASFGGKDFPLVAANFILSDLVLVTRAVTASAGVPNALEVQALSGETGKPLAGVETVAFRSLWNPEGIERIAAKTTDASGLALFASPEARSGGGVFIFAHRGLDLALDMSASYPYGAPQPPKTSSSLLFTDRSIYRPLQKISWKVLGYRGDAQAGRFEVFPAAPVTVTLFDQNNQKIDARTVATNDFGSAAGEFMIPAGRALGSWRLESSLGGAQAAFRVEEYKRPTFEVTWRDPTEPLRLNRPARVTGEARYYFGLPVASGSVRWRVTRTPQYFWWSPWWWTPNPAARTQTIATGVADLRSDGTFEVVFRPAADERLEKESKDLTYAYRVEADASDEGGETRSATRSFRLGFVAIEARLDAPPGFLLEARPGRLRIVRTNLDGVPRQGKGSWRIARLEQPEKPMLPADQPPTITAWAGLLRRGRSSPESFQTPGDALRPRWDTDYTPERMIRLWKDGAEVAHGDLAHDAKGEATLEVAGLPAGAYRLHYRTVDDFGAVFEMPKEFLVGGSRTPLALPAVLAVESVSVSVGETARFLVTSGLPDQMLFFDIYSAGRRVERRELSSNRSPALVEIPVAEKDRGGFSVKLSALRDHQWMTLSQSVLVPWDDKKLKVSFSTFRDRLQPGTRETWRVKVEAPKGSKSEEKAAELLAYMYDRSLDAFVGHIPPDPLSTYPIRTGMDWSRANLGQAAFQYVRERFPDLPDFPVLRGDSLKFYGGYAVGGPGRRGGIAGGVPGGMAREAQPVTVMGEAPLALSAAAPKAVAADRVAEVSKASVAPAPTAPVALRSEFAETAFWRPHLLTGPDGSASIEFTVPDSVTSWNVFVHAVTRDWKAGSVKKEAKSVKDLMVRPYVPRFLREGDRADLKIVVNNASDKEMSGRITIDILDPDSNASALAAFGVAPEKASLPFTAAAGRGANVTVSIAAPKRVGLYAFKVTAVSGDTSDGELRPVPLLPGRVHLVQSRFVTLHDRDRREMMFADLAREDDPTRVNDQMVVTVDAQLFNSVLQALPYLVNYPYECTEQTLNRFVSTGIVSALFRDYPAVAKMAEELSKRDTRLETWDTLDANRRMALEETPWLETAKGGRDTGQSLSRVLDPRVAKAERETALARLRKAQTESGGFPWWPGGPPSSYMTVYILHGFANALEFGAEVPKDIVQKAWAYAGTDVRRDLGECMHLGHFCPMVTFVNYTLSSYPDETWYKPAFDAAYRRTLLDYSFAHWKEHSPMLKGQLALTLKRMGRPADARLVWDSVMDSAKTDRDTGTSWAPEDRSWLWYNDTIETQAFALRAENELAPADPRRPGLVQWLFLNKKLNQWKSTRATAEVIASVAKYLKMEGALGIREDATVIVGGVKTAFVFEPDRYTGAKNQVVVPGDKLDAKTASTVIVEKGSRGLAFASATWHFSTEKLPAEDRGDFFAVSRKYFKREATAAGFVLRPLAEGTPLAPGDEVEVQLSLSSKHEAEYVHVRDPRAAGLEPENVASRHKWDLGIVWYEETRDSGTNFFFERLPAGQYTLHYRLRANMAGVFRVGPATVQSMYAPEFAAYSAGATVRVAP